MKLRYGYTGKGLIIGAILLLAGATILNPSTTKATDLNLYEFNTVFTTSLVHMIYPSTCDPKAPGCSPARITDWHAAAQFYSKLPNVTEKLDNNPLIVNQTTGEPLLAAGSSIACFGGPLVNAVTMYYESVNPPPVCCSIHDNTMEFIHESTGQIVSMPLDRVNRNYDYFLIQTFKDAEDRNVLICYGFGWKGTIAAGKYFHKVLYPALDINDNSWTIVRWDDTNRDGFINGPDDGDTYTLVATA